jgi:tetratricopeptide (TPR) repeat protein
MPTLLEALTMGLECHRAGRLKQAENIYRQILAQEPDNPDALHLLGMVYHHSGRHQIAAEYIGRAIEANGSIAPFHANLGGVLHSLGRLEEAVRSFEQAIRLDPASLEAHVNLGNALQDLGRPAGAVEHYRRALEMDPRRAEVYNNLGNALTALGRYDEALTAFRQALQLRPDYAEAYSNRATALKRIGRLEEAEDSLRQAIRLRPGLAAAHSNLAAVLIARHCYAEAESCCREALRLDPKSSEAHANLSAIAWTARRYSEAEREARLALDLNPADPVSWNNLGNALQEQDRVSDAIQCYRRALEIDPHYAEAYANLGNSLAARLALTEALDCYGQALRIDPEHVNAHWNRSLALLLRGEFAAGWKEYEWRWRKPEYSKRRFSRPRWRGEDPAGKTILIHAEQGLGDTIQFVRYLPMVRDLGARVILECQAALIPLFRGFPGCGEMIPAQSALPDYDLHAPLLSLPALLGTTLESVPAAIPYLNPPAESVALWARRLAGYPGLKVGVVWAGNPDHPNDHKRSMPVECLAPLAGLSGITLLSLQCGRPPAPSHLRLAPLGPEVADLAEEAARIRNLDLLITVDSMPAHLAGAIGAPVWTLLAYVPDFRWMLDRADTPWYPTMRLFRQPEPGDWASVIGQVCRRLQEMRKP